MKVSMMGEASDLLLEDLELLHQEIQEFNTACNTNKPLDIPQTLENYLQYVAKSGNTVFPWPHVRSLFRLKMMNAMQQFQEPTCPSESFVLERFDLFRVAAPFTVQRLTELILQPTRHYRKKEKFLRGLEKTVLVVSTVEPRSVNNDEEKNGNMNNSSASSEEAENVTFNRTFSLDRHDVVTSVRTSSIDIISQNISVSLSADNIVLDPVTSTAIAVVDPDVMDQSIAVVNAEGIITENVASSDVTVDVITPPDADIAVNAETLIVDAIPETSTAIVNIESIADATTAEDTSAVMECESSNVVDVPPVSILQCVSEHDLVAVSTAVQQPTDETLSAISAVEVDVMDQSIAIVTAEGIITTETVTSSDVTVADVIPPPGAGIPVNAESLIADVTPETSTTAVVNIESTADAATTDDTTTIMECESSNVVDVSVTPVSLIQCVSEQDLVTVAAAAEQPTTDEAICPSETVLENVSPSLVHMDAVKLPIEGGESSADTNVEISSQPTALTESNNDQSE